MMRKTIAGAVAAAALVAPGVTHAAGAATSPAPHASYGLSYCTSADLTASYAGGDGAAGHVYGRIVLTNVSDLTCVTGGYGGLSYVGGGDGTQVGAPADRDDAHAAKMYRVHPGQRVVQQVAETSFGVYDRSTCRPRHVDGFRFYVPNETRSKFIKHPTTGCANSHVHLLSHRAFHRP